MADGERQRGDGDVHRVVCIERQLLRRRLIIPAHEVPGPHHTLSTLKTPSRAGPMQSAYHGALLGLSGGFAGAVAKTCVAPLERIKLLNQAGTSVGSFTTLHKVVVNEGWPALWRGNTANVARMVPNKGVLLACSDVYRDALKPLKLSTFWGGAIGGAFAGATAILVTYPLDLARTRMAGFIVSRGEASLYTTTYGTVSAIYRLEGPRGLFRGMGPTLAGSFPYEGIKFGTYACLKRRLEHGDGGVGSVGSGGHGSGSGGSGGISAPWRAACGAFAATLAHVLTYPNDTVRRRLQLQGAAGTTLRYHGWLDCLRKVCAEEGWRALYAGLGITILRGVPNTGIQFTVYEACKDAIKRSRRGTD